MAARNYHPGQLFRRYHLPVISAEQNDGKSEEINAIGEPQAEDRPVCLLCLAAAQNIAR